MSSSQKKNLPAKVESPKSKKKKVITISIVVAVVLIVIGVVAAIVISSWDEYQQLAADREVVATCNGYEIPYEELRFVTMFYKDMLCDKYGADIWDDPATAEEHREELEALVMENLNENYVILAACRSLSISTSGKVIDDYVDKQMKELRDSFDSKKAFQDWMDEHWMTEHYMRFSIGISFLESGIYETLLEYDMYAYSQDNMQEFKEYVLSSGDYVRTIHVYIENVEGEDPAANLAKAQEISDALKAVADVEERRALMSEYIGSVVNDDLYSISGDGYYFTRGEMDEDYENAAFDLELGETSDPVVCSGGTFVIMRLVPEEDYITKNAQTLLNNYHSVAVGVYEDQYRPDCVVVLNEYGQSIDLVAME